MVFVSVSPNFADRFSLESHWLSCRSLLKNCSPGGWRRLWWYGFLAILEVPENHWKPWQKSKNESLFYSSLPSNHPVGPYQLQRFFGGQKQCSQALAELHVDVAAVWPAAPMDWKIKAWREAGEWMTLKVFQSVLGGGFKYFLFSPLPGEDSHFDKYFSDGLKPPTRVFFFNIL